MLAFTFGEGDVLGGYSFLLIYQVIYLFIFLDKPGPLALCTLSLVVASDFYSLVLVPGFSLQSMGSRPWAQWL